MTTPPPDGFDHDAYVRARLPRFVRVGMGLEAPRSGPPPAPGTPARVSRTPDRVGVVRPATAATPVKRVAPPTEKPQHVSPPDQPKPAHRTPTSRSTTARQRDVDAAVRHTVAAFAAAPVWIILLLLLIAVLRGPADPPRVVINDHPRCAGPARTVSPDVLATYGWWEDC